MNENNLKPCPFCGGEAISQIDHDSRSFTVFCESCPAEIKRTFTELGLGDGSFMDFDEVARAMDELVELWNRRATDGKAEAD